MSLPDPTAEAPLLPLARFRLKFAPATAADAEKLASLRDAYLGSAWRGAFGHALKQSVCVTKLAECDDCPLVGSCPYPYLFESRTPAGAEKLRRYPFTPGPYVFEPGQPMQGALHLAATLFGPAIEHLPTFVQALSRAARRGLTSRRVALEMAGVEAECPPADGQQAQWQLVHEPRRPGSVLRSTRPAAYEPPGQVPAAVRVRLLAPLRIRQNGRNVGPRDLDARALSGALVRRISLLTYFFSDTPLETDFAALLRHAGSIRLEDVELRWRDGARRSSRQAATVPLGGIAGRFVLCGDLAPLWPFLWLGQWTHAGKGCSMGLGRYVLDAAPGAGSQKADWPSPVPL